MVCRARLAPLFWFIFALAAAGCQKLTPQQEHFDRGYKAYQSGDFSTALLYLKPLVEAGHPAAQLLMAKMYSKGEGVPEDMGKAELLRNIASYQVYKKKDLTPGEVRPANSTLKEVSERLDYFAGAGDTSKGVPQDLGKALESIDLKGLVDAQKIPGDVEGVPADVPIDIPREVPSGEAAAPQRAMPPSEQAPAARTMPERQVAQSADTRRNEQISLSLVRQAAEGGDPMAMELLSAAYAKGFYGLTPNAAQSMLWAKRLSEARLRGIKPPEIDPLEKVPLAPVCGIVGVGIALVGLGIWRWRKSRLR